MKAVRGLALTLLVTGVLALAVSAQQPFPSPAPGPRDLAGIAAYAGHAGMQWQMHSRGMELARQYTKAEKESEKREIKEKLTELLNQQFDEHMQQQQKELEELEKQIADLRALMKKRTAAKGTIVDRRIEQMIQDADGLGWNAPGVPGGMRPFWTLNDFTPKPATAPAAKKATEPRRERDKERE
jgi:hypothetical protein